MANLLSLSGKVAVVTGGGSGIGKSISQLFARQGAFVAILDFEEKGATHTLEGIQSEAGKGAIFIGDVSNKESVKGIFGKINSTAGGINILVNNAGIAHVGNLENTSE